MSDLSTALKFLWLTDEEPTRRQVFFWRLIVSCFMTVSVLFAVWALGGLSGASGLAYADDVDVKIQQAIAPVNTRLTSIESEQTVQGGFLKTLVKNDFARLIRSELRARCKSTSSEEKERINAAIVTYQEGYENAAGEKYEEPDCEDL